MATTKRRCYGHNLLSDCPTRITCWRKGLISRFAWWLISLNTGKAGAR